MPRPARVHPPLCAYVDPLVAKLKRLTPAALRGTSADAVHDARVATRRLMVAMELIDRLDGGAPAGEMQKTLRRLRRRLSRVRDLDVMLINLRRLGATPEHRAVSKWLAGRLRDVRRAAIKKLRKREERDEWIDEIDAWKKLRPRVEKLGVVALRQATALSLRERIEHFREQAERLCARLTDGPADADFTPHELRITGKLLRYTLELAAKTDRKPRLATRLLYRRLQRELGLWHDHLVLCERAMSELVDSQLALHDSALAAQVLAAAQLWLRRSDQRLQRFAALWREHRAALTRPPAPA